MADVQHLKAKINGQRLQIAEISHSTIKPSNRGRGKEWQCYKFYRKFVNSVYTMVITITRRRAANSDIKHNVKFSGQQKI